MAAALDDSPAVHHEDLVDGLEARQPVRDDEGRPVATGLQQTRHQRGRPRRVEVLGRLVQHPNGSVRQQRPRDHQALALPAGETVAVLTELGAEPFGEPDDPVVEPDVRQHSPQLPVRRVGPADAEVGLDARVEHVGVLLAQHDPAVQLAWRQLRQGHAPQGHVSGLRVEETHQESGQRGLAGAARSDNGDPVTGTQRQVHAVEGPGAVDLVARAHPADVERVGPPGPVGGRRPGFARILARVQQVGHPVAALPEPGERGRGRRQPGHQVVGAQHREHDDGEQLVGQASLRDGDDPQQQRQPERGAVHQHDQGRAGPRRPRRRPLQRGQLRADLLHTRQLIRRRAVRDEIRGAVEQVHDRRRQEAAGRGEARLGTSYLPDRDGRDRRGGEEQGAGQHETGSRHQQPQEGRGAGADDSGDHERLTHAEHEIQQAVDVVDQPDQEIAAAESPRSGAPGAGERAVDPQPQLGERAQRGVVPDEPLGVPQQPS